MGRHYRGRDEETFGKRSLDERNRENRNNYRYRIFGPFFSIPENRSYGQNRNGFQKGQNWGRRNNFNKQNMSNRGVRSDVVPQRNAIPEDGLN